MDIKIVNAYGITVFDNVTAFDTFRGLVASGQKIQAIKYIREKESMWGLKECKDFVDHCAFPPQVVGEMDPFSATLRDIKFDLREMVTDEYAMSRSRILDIYDKVVGLIK